MKTILDSDAIRPTEAIQPEIDSTLESHTSQLSLNSNTSIKSNHPEQVNVTKIQPIKFKKKNTIATGLLSQQTQQGPLIPISYDKPSGNDIHRLDKIMLYRFWTQF